MARQAVQKPLTARHRQIITYRYASRKYVVAVAHALDIVRQRMVHAVLAAPIGIRREGEKAAQSADPRVGPSRGEE
jgi:hypothetical protein